MNSNEPPARPIALVTGASGGIGRACALALASRLRADVAVHYNSSSTSAEAVVKELLQLGVNACAIQANLGESGAAVKLVEATATQLGPPSILIHAAGHLLEKPIAFTKPEEWDALFEVHVISGAMLAKEMARHLRKSERGRVVFIGSLAGRIGLGNAAAYAAAKGALEGLCKSFALEAARWRTTVNVIAPGFVETHMTADQSPEKREANLESVPLKRFGSAEEIGALSAFLCSPDAAYITGQTIVIDGGAAIHA